MVKNFFGNKKKKQKQATKVSKMVAIASLPAYMADDMTYIDSNGLCYTLTIQKNPTSFISDDFFHQFYKYKLKSFQSFQTGKISLGSEDFARLIESHHSYINDVSQITGRTYDQVMMDFAQYHNSKELLIQPQGLSRVLHRLSNGAFISNAAIQSVFATAQSHVSGVKGMSLICSAPGLIIFVPLVGGIFFGSLERLAADTPAQPVLIIARDACLLTPKIVEIAYNEVFIGPLIRRLGIDAPLNVTSMLRFGSGTKRMMGSVLNSTLTTISNAVPTKFY